MRKIVPLIFIVILSCKNETVKLESQAAKTIVVADREENLGSLLERIKNFNFIELKGLENENIIAKVDKVVCHNNLFYVLDSMKSNLLVFDRDGHFKTKIGVRGNGPGEFQIISDFVINKTKNEIVLLSTQNIGVFIFSLENFKYKKTIKFDSFFPKQIGIIDDKYLALFTSSSNDSYHDIVYVDLNGKTVKENFKYPENIADIAFRFSGGINNFGSLNYYTTTSSPNVYRLNDDFSYDLLYSFDLGLNSWKHDDRYNLGKFNEKLSSMSLSFLNNSFFEANNIFTFRYTDKNKIRRGFYNNTTNKVYDDLSFSGDGFVRILDNIVGIEEDKFISAYNGEFYNSMIEHFPKLEESIKKIDSKFYDRLSKIDEMDTSHYLIFFNFDAN